MVGSGFRGFGVASKSTPDLECAAHKDVVEGTHWNRGWKGSEFGSRRAEAVRLQHPLAERSPDIIEISSEEDGCVMGVVCEKWVFQEPPQLDLSFQPGKPQMDVGDGEHTPVSLAVDVAVSHQCATPFFQRDAQVNMFSLK